MIVKNDWGEHGINNSSVLVSKISLVNRWVNFDWECNIICFCIRFIKFKLGLTEQYQSFTKPDFFRKLRARLWWNMYFHWIYKYIIVYKRSGYPDIFFRDYCIFISRWLMAGKQFKGFLSIVIVWIYLKARANKIEGWTKNWTYYALDMWHNYTGFYIIYSTKKLKVLSTFFLKISWSPKRFDCKLINFLVQILEWRICLVSQMLNTVRHMLMNL